MAKANPRLAWATRPWARGLGVALVALLAYWQATQVGFLSDDHLFVAFAQFRTGDFSLLRVSPNGLFYRPLGTVVWRLQFDLWRHNAAAYHVVSVGLHALNSVLVVALARHFWPRRPGLALSAGLLFAVLPFSIETVVWLSSLYDLLATLFYLLTLLVFIRAWRGGSPWLYALGLGLYQLCLWSKEAAFSLPLVLGVVALLLPERPRPRTIVLSVLPLLGLVAINLAQRIAMRGDIGGYTETVYGDWRQVLINLGAVGVKLLAPYNLRLFGPVRLWVTLLSMTALGLLGLWAARRQRTVWLSAAWLALTVAVFVNISGVGADLQNTRYLYLPAVGYVIGLVEVLQGAARWMGGQRRWLGRAAVAGLAGYYFVLAQVQIQPWITATRISDSLAEEIHTLTAGARPASVLQVANLPDNYQGAYIYRNGLDAVQLYRYGEIFNWSRLDSAELPPAAKLPWPADLYQFEVGYGAEQTVHVMSARALGLNADQALPAGTWLSRLRPDIHPMAAEAMAARRPPVVGQWSFAACEAEALRAWGVADGRCVAGPGLALAGAELAGPALAARRAGWLKVIVALTVPSGVGGEGALTLRWLPAANSERPSQTLAVPAGPFEGAVHFFVPPGGGGMEHIQLLAQGAGTLTRIREVSVFALK